MHASAITPEVVARANELYWGSDRSVNQIADELELSKGALYGIIEPASSGLGCPLCGDEVVYSNRTAKDKGMLDCPTCDWDGTPDETVDTDDVVTPSTNGAQAAARDGSAGDGAVPDAVVPTTATDVEHEGGDDTPVDSAERLPPAPYVRPSMRTAAGGALIGAAVGLALVLWARKK